MFKNSFKVLMIVLLAFAWLTPVQPVSAASDTATFTFESLTNPSLYLVGTTFRLSATGTNAEYPPFGPVKFYDNGAEIVGCSGKYLNYVSSTSTPTAGLPAECTVSNLSIGTHTITAVFTSYLPEYYDGTTQTLTHEVTYYPLTISPDVLPEGQWMLGYLQYLTASGGTGSYIWSRSGDFPEYLTLLSNTGEMYGSTGTIGSNSFTITVVDNAGGYGTKDYTLTINKALPNVTVTTMNVDTVYADSPVDAYLFANVRHPSSNGSITQPVGTAAFSIDGTVIPACSAKPVTDGYTYEHCTFNTAGLTAGVHTVSVLFTPTDSYYEPASGEITFTVLPARYTVSGKIFYDLDKDGFKDSTESAPSKGFKVNYDINCDGEVDSYTWSGNNISGDGEFSITQLSAGASYCVFLDQLLTGEVQTTTIGPETLDQNKYHEIGVYFPDLLYSPVLLPDGAVGVSYSQAITISGGTAPYTISNVELSLPAGLTFDESTLVISGTPTIGGSATIAFDVTDGTGFIDEYSNSFIVKAEGTFEITSSKNPSALAEEVTFTFTGTGEAIINMMGTEMTVPPIGMVSFFDNGAAIDGCSSLYLNVNMSTYETGQYPVTCSTSALTEGSHEISVEFIDMLSGIFGDTTRALTQLVGVQPDTTPPTIMSNVVGAIGSNDWYTSDVSLTWVVADAESSITSQTGCDTISVSTDQADTTYTCTAASEGGEASQSVTFKRDTTKPVTSISGVTNGAKYKLGSVPQAVCSTVDAFSGVATEASLVTTGGNSSGLGTFTATCAGALDAAGNAADAVSVSYTVAQPSDLLVYVFDSRDPVRPGASMSYTMLIANFGPYSAKGVSITDTLDSKTQFVSISKPRGWTCAAQSGVITCNTSSLSRGSVALITINVKVSNTAVSGQVLSNSASITSQMFETDPSDNSDIETTRVRR